MTMYWLLALTNVMPLVEHAGLLNGVAGNVVEYVSATAELVVQPRKSHSCVGLVAQVLDPAAA